MDKVFVETRDLHQPYDPLYESEVMPAIQTQISFDEDNIEGKNITDYKKKSIFHAAYISFSFGSLGKCDEFYCIDEYSMVLIPKLNVRNSNFFLFFFFG